MTIYSVTRVTYIYIYIYNVTCITIYTVTRDQTSARKKRLAILGGILGLYFHQQFIVGHFIECFLEVGSIWHAELYKTSLDLNFHALDTFGQM